MAKQGDRGHAVGAAKIVQVDEIGSRQAHDEPGGQPQVDPEFPPQRFTKASVRTPQFDTNLSTISPNWAGPARMAAPDRRRHVHPAFDRAAAAVRELSPTLPCLAPAVEETFTSRRLRLSGNGGWGRCRRGVTRSTKSTARRWRGSNGRWRGYFRRRLRPTRWRAVSFRRRRGSPWIPTGVRTRCAPTASPARSPPKPAHRKNGPGGCGRPALSAGLKPTRACPASFRSPPAPYREQHFSRGPGFCCVCGQPVYRFGWHLDLWDAGANKNATWHSACVAAWQFWNAPSDQVRVLRRLQARRCAGSGSRLWKTAEVDHRVPLFRVWGEHRDAPWPTLLGYWGMPNLQVINRDVHVAKCGEEAQFRRVNLPP